MTVSTMPLATARGTLTEKQMIAAAIGPMFQACGNSYINAWLEEWLFNARRLGVYDGPLVGRIVEIDVDHWCELAAQKSGYDKT